MLLWRLQSCGSSLPTFYPPPLPVYLLASDECPSSHNSKHATVLPSHSLSPFWPGLITSSHPAWFCHWHLISFKHNSISHSSQLTGLLVKGVVPSKCFVTAMIRRAKEQRHKDWSKSGGGPQHSLTDQSRKTRGMGEGTGILSVSSRQQVRC